MISPRCPLILILLGILALWPQDLARAQERHHVGWVEEVSGPAYRIRRGSKTKELLQADRDRYLFLYPGDSVGCDEGGILKINLFGKLKTIPPSANPTPIPLPPATPADADQRAIEDYGRTGGRPRGDESEGSPDFFAGEQQCRPAGEFCNPVGSRPGRASCSFYATR